MNLPFLVEIGTEELPPKALKTLSLSFQQGIKAGLRAANLEAGHLHGFAAPRRLAVLVDALATQQPDQQIEKLGPNVAAAFDKDGNPSKAADGFARSCGVAFDQLIRITTDKGERLGWRSLQPGLATAELLPGIVQAALDQLPIPKRMRWGARRAEFVRPVHWVVMLLGKEIVPATILGIQSGRETRGHRFHHNLPIALEQAQDYQLTLENHAYVIADFDQRRGRIRHQVETLGATVGGHAVIDEDLLDEVTGLVEWPVALAGRFESRFLSVPQEALISSMKEHQKYFHVVDVAGKLLPHFITVANIESRDPAKVIDGNERVIRPRLSDAAFFYETDLKMPLAQRREQLKTVVFQEKLGSVFDKTERIASLAGFLAERIGADRVLAERAGQLSKADLVSGMVGEFAEMQGIAGAYYARHDGEPAAVADAVREHYQPRFAGDELPQSTTSVCVALADRLDTLVGIFGIGQLPTGSKDPFALRRAALGVLRLLIEKGFDLDLRECLQHAQAQFPQFAQQPELGETILAFILERLRASYEDQLISPAVFMAVSAKNLSRPLDIDQRVQAVHRFTLLPEAAALASANKRVANLLAKQAVEELQATPAPALFSAAAERQLAEQVATLQQRVTPLFEARQYRLGLELLADLRSAVDQFFEEVMVMTEDVAVRNNRLALLQQLRSLFFEVADISLLAPAGR